MIDITNLVLDVSNQLSPTVGNALTLGVTFGFFAVGVIKATKDAHPKLGSEIIRRIKSAFEVKEMTEQEVKEYVELSNQGELLNIREGLRA